MERLLDSQFRGTTDSEKVVFEESCGLDFADTRLASRRVLDAVTHLHQERAANHEARFAGPLDPDNVQFNDWIFRHHGADNTFRVALADKTEIIVYPSIFKQDAEKMLTVLYAHQEALRQVGPVKVYIGARRIDSAFLGRCTISSGDITFYSDQHDGLYATGLADVTKADAHPVILSRAVLHEMAHVLERNPEVGHALSLLRFELETITEAAIRAPHREPEDFITPGLMAAAKAINPEYLPGRIRDSILVARHEFKLKAPMEEVMVHADLMASEFWAEIFATRVWEKKSAPISRESSPGFYLLEKYIETYGEKLRPGLPFQKGEVRERRRSLRYDLDERIEYFGSRGSVELSSGGR